MNTHRARRSGGLCLLVLMALVLVALPAVPAAADHVSPPWPEAGSGTLEGTEVVDDQEFLGFPCFKVNQHVFGLRGAGTYYGRTASGEEVVYRPQINEGGLLYRDGPLQVEVENTGTYYHGPLGTHGGDTSCSAATSKSAIPAQFRIFAADHVYRLDDTGAQVPCTGQGSFARGDMTQEQNWQAEWTLSEDCVVVGNEAGTPGTGTAPVGTEHTHHGNHAPCSSTCFDNFKVDYKQYLPIEGPFLALTGPASASTGQAVTVTARVTEDGNSVPAVPVTFTVDGPAPAAPAVGAGVTGTDGQATFTFTAADVGDYTVSASAAHADRVLSSSHTVRFAAAEPPTVSLAGSARGQTEDQVTLTATVTDSGGNPASGASVEFAVVGPGEVTPASGVAVTDANGQAQFSFSGDRAGRYTVTASAIYLGEQVSATHTVDIEVRTLYREEALVLTADETVVEGAVIDPGGKYAYFGTRQANQVVKVDLDTFERVGTIHLGSDNKFSNFKAGVIDPDGRYAYLGTSTSPGRVIKIDLDTFERVGTITFDSGENSLQSALIDPGGAFAYFGMGTTGGGRVVKVDLATFQRVGAITFQSDERMVGSAVIDPDGGYAYYGVGGASGGKVVKVDLGTFQRVGAVTLVGDAETGPSAAVIDPAGRYAYFGTSHSPGHVVKIDLDSFQRVGAIAFLDTRFGPGGPAGSGATEASLVSAVIDPTGSYAYFGTAGSKTGPIAGRVIKVDLKTFERAYAIPLAPDETNLQPAVIEPDGSHAYFGTAGDVGTVASGDEVPAKVVKVALTRPPNPALAVADDTYATDYLTALEVPAPGVLDNDGPGLSAHNASDPAGGSVELRPDGSFTYTPDEGFSGTDTFTYTASDGMDYSPPATVSISVGAAPEGVSSVGGGALGYFTNVSLFGGPFEPRGPDPTVTLPSTGSATPITASSPSASAVYGPATIFESGALDVSTSGSTGPEGSSTASASVLDVGPGPLFGDSMASTCTSNESSSTGDTTLSGTRVVVSMGEDWDSEADDEVVTIPDNPAPNTEVHGAIENVGDYFRVVFNEQIPGPDAMTVNAAHMYLEGPTAIGEVVIGQSRCAVAASVPNEAPTAGDDAYSTGADTPLTISLPGVLANDSDVAGDSLTAAKLVPAFPASPSANWSFPSDPANGALVLNHDGSFTYTPNQGFVGTDSFPYRVADPRGATDEATVTITVEAAATIKAPVADFDGDGDSDRSVFRNGAWYAEGQPAVFFGVSGDIPVPGDYNGDGTIERAVYRKGAWYIEGQPTVFLGNATDIPVPGDYDGDGTTEPAVYRKGTWYIDGQPSVFLGNASDVPVPGDYDGDGTTEAAVYRNGAWHIHGQATVFHGVNGDIPIPGDYDADGSTDRAVYRKGAWYVAGQPTVFLGNATDVPVPGDYDANGSTERAVYRNGVWYVQGQPNAFLGVKGDIPLPLPQAIHRAFFSAS